LREMLCTSTRPLLLMPLLSSTCASSTTPCCTQGSWSESCRRL
jgi:hypothetical protein